MATCAMIIRMFDFEGRNCLTLPQFEALCGYLNAWRDMFNKAGGDRCGAINFTELQTALKSMGYVLSPSTLSRMWLVYDEDRSGSLEFDEYIMVRGIHVCAAGMPFGVGLTHVPAQLMAELKMTTTAFAKLDTARVGRITLDFNAYLQLMLQTKVL